DKATLTLGDNRKVDFSQSLIFMTSNLGAAEMSNLIAPKLGFKAAAHATALPELDKRTSEKLAKSGMDAARRKFTPEFMNRIDKTVVFKSLGQSELRRILNLELAQVQQRIYQSPAQRSFAFTVSEASKDFLLNEGTDVKYGARHLKRAIERLLVQPISNLIATDQVSAGDWISIDFDPDRKCLVFTSQEEDQTSHRMTTLMGANFRVPGRTGAESPQREQIRAVSARGSKK
ncbi:MAG: ATPase domain protein, partial [Bryobacterales bacterium]|nr:ATPase domain protein [Bryobacterales bacterium]